MARGVPLRTAPLLGVLALIPSCASHRSQPERSEGPIVAPTMRGGARDDAHQADEKPIATGFVAWGNAFRGETPRAVITVDHDGALEWLATGDLKGPGPEGARGGQSPFVFQTTSITRGASSNASPTAPSRLLG